MACLLLAKCSIDSPVPGQLIRGMWLCSVDPFTRKDWYDVKAPSMFTNRSVGKTLVTRTQGTKVRLQAEHDT